MTILARALGLDAAHAYYHSLPTSDGLRACLDQVLCDRNFDPHAIKAVGKVIPATGPLLVTANHPTGVLDGVVLLAAVLERRDDVFIVANETMKKFPVLANRVIPINKSNRHAPISSPMMKIRTAWKQGGCVIVFPAGTVAHWQWPSLRIAEAPWDDRVLRLAAALRVPEIRAVISLTNPPWFHFAAALSRSARTLLLARVFLLKSEHAQPVPITLNHVTSYQALSG